MSRIPQRIGVIGSVAIMESPPGAPVLQSAVPATSTITLTWTSSSTGGSPITSYQVLRSTTSGGETVLASGLSPTVFTYADSTPSGTTTYFYTVEAVNAIGTSPQSNELSAALPPAPTVPVAPVLTLASPGNGSVSLNWTASATGGSPLTSYTLLRGTASGSETSYVTGISARVLNYVDTAATNGTTYFYKLEAINAIGTSAASNELSATPGSGVTVPPAPTLGSASPGNGIVTLSWSPNGTGGSAIISYTVLRSLTSGGETTYHSGVTGTTYVDSAVTDGTTYFYRVIAINSVGASLQSNELSATPAAVAPGTPVLVATATGSDSFGATGILNWTQPTTGGSPITHYLVYRGPTATSLTLLATVGNVLTYTDPTLIVQNTYFYTVQAQNAVGTGPQSNVESVTPLNPRSAPSAPQSLAATAGNSLVAFTWVAPASTGGSPITSYTLLRGTSPSGPFPNHITGISPTATSYTDTTSVVNGTTYYYELVALNSTGGSPSSNMASATPLGTTGVVVAQQSATGGPPTARGQGYGAYHPGTGLLYYFGGNGPPTGAAFSDTWSYNPSTKVWAQLTTATAPANVAVGMGYDPISAKIIQFGGDNGSTFFNTTASLDPTVGSPDWTLLNPTTKPAIRSGHSMFNDPVTGHLMMYGGNTGTPTYYDDLWTWNGTNWVLVNSALTGTARSGAFVATIGNGTTVIFGGNDNVVLNDTHVWNGTTCVQAHPATSPPARSFGGCAETNTGLALIYGGANRDSTVNESDCWIWDGTNWTQQTPTGATIGGLSSQAMNWAPNVAQIISAFGTVAVDTDINTVYTLSVGAAPPPPPPSAVPAGFYNGHQLAGATSLSASLGLSPLQGYSDYTTGTSYTTIGSYTPPTMVTGCTLMLGVNMVDGNENISQVPANLSHYTNLANNLKSATNAGNPVICRVGWEFDIGTGTGGYGHVQTQAAFISAWQQIVTTMKAANPAIKYDFCCNTGTSTLTQLEGWYPGDAYVDYIGGDHYNNSGSGTASNTFSAFGPSVNLASIHNKPVSCGEWGLNGGDSPQFIIDAAQFFLNPTAAASRYGWPAYTVRYQSYFSFDFHESGSIDSDITEFPNSFAQYKTSFG